MIFNNSCKVKLSLNPIIILMDFYLSKFLPKLKDWPSISEMFSLYIKFSITFTTSKE